MGIDVKKIRKELGMTQLDLAKELGVDRRTIINYEKGETIPQSKVKLLHFIESKAENKYDSHNSSTDFVEEESLKYNLEKGSNKVPYYDIDVTSHITTSFKDINEAPSFYVDYEPFNDCTAYVNNYGDSMFPKYKNGERLAVKQMFNLDGLLWGETYLIITNPEANDLRTVKDVFPHKDESKIILRASNPNYAGDTVIEKKNILSIFAIKGKITQNFI